VVAQTGCTEEKAREALEAQKGDLINASEWASLGVHRVGLERECYRPVVVVRACKQRLYCCRDMMLMILVMHLG
jgi:hypothetical protein